MKDEEKIQMMREKKGIVAALDQSINSTPAALRAYGIPDESYQTKTEMLNLIHDMRCRIMENSEFCSTYIIAAILYTDTVNRKMEDLFVSEYLWQKKGIISFMKIDDGLDVRKNGVNMMKSIESFEEKIHLAKAHHMFGTKMRSLIVKANEVGIKNLVKQQFDVARQIMQHDLLPIIEPEVEIHSPDKKTAELILKDELLRQLDQLEDSQQIIIELSLPVEANFYKEIVEHPRVVRVLAASGGYKKAEADRKLSQNQGIIASFSRALEEGLAYHETDFEFDWTLKESIEAIFKASID